MRALRTMLPSLFPPKDLPAAATSSPTLSHPADSAAQTRPTITTRPLIGTMAVLLGSVISTLDSRITSFGLADVEGAVHAGFDEGAWITTAFTVGQMLVGPIAAWLGMVFGVRRLLMIGGVVFAISNLLLPFSPNLHFVLAFQFMWCRTCLPDW
jgi:MFS transporter, DHA2 family, multidrug resistance protein